MVQTRAGNPRNDVADRWLLATVGERDPETEEGPTGPLRAAQKVQPTRAVLIHTRDAVFSDRARATVSRMERDVHGIHVQLVEMREPDPTWIAPLLNEVQRVLMSLRVDLGDEVHVCATSGTPQMGLALTLVADARFPAARHWQALNPGKARGDLLRAFEPDAVRHHPEMVAAFHALATCRVRDARDRFDRRLNGQPDVIGPVRPWLDAGYRTSSALALVEDFQLQSLPRVLRRQNLGRAPLERSPAFSALVDWYGNLTGNQGRRTNPRWPVELAALALREFRAERPSLAIVRLALAHEVALQVRLLEAHGVDVDRLNPEMLRRIEPALGNEVKGRLVPLGHDAAGKLGAHRLDGVVHRFMVLAHLEPGLAERVSGEMRRSRDQLVEIRNDLVHRGVYGQQDKVPAVFERGIDYVAFLFTHFGWDDPREVPSAPVGVESVANQLAALAGVNLTG